MCSRLMFSEFILIPGKNVISISGAWTIAFLSLKRARGKRP